MARRGVIQLLDSEQGHPLRIWDIEDRSRVTIGRAEENDVVVADPYVSRAHAYLQFDPAHDQWRLVSISQQQIVCQGQTCRELPLSDGMVFRLGPRGCYLRFGQKVDDAGNRKTLSHDTTLIPLLALDPKQMQSEVEAIIDGEYFQNLKRAASLRRGEQSSTETKLS